MRSGAFEYVTKPLDLDELRAIIRHALSSKAVAIEPPDAPHPRAALVGDSAGMQEVFKLIGVLAANDVPALVVGERGTGKELVVATIHENSARREEPFVTVDCANLPSEAVETELGRLDRGFVHLAAVHALSRAAQLRVLRLLRDEAGRGSRGSAQIRILTSTDRELVDAVDDGSFNVELYELISVITVRLKPLRDRRGDIPPLVRHFVQRFNDELSRNFTGVDEATLRRLTEYSWPGNAAELESVLKRACIVARGDMITLTDLGDSLSGVRALGRQGAESALARAARTALHERLVEKSSDTESLYHDIVDVVELALVDEALTITNGNQVKASDLLGVNRATLRKKAER
jgi:DNA-binding NtrC family response regulator